MTFYDNISELVISFSLAYICCLVFIQLLFFLSKKFNEFSSQINRRVIRNEPYETLLTTIDLKTTILSCCLTFIRGNAWVPRFGKWLGVDCGNDADCEKKCLESNYECNVINDSLTMGSAMGQSGPKTE